jgi:cystathionine gamma-lyase
MIILYIIILKIYPGLPSHPQHELAKRQQKGFGGIISIYLKDEVDINAFLKSLKIFTLAESLGAVESLINNPRYPISSLFSPTCTHSIDRPLTSTSSRLVK